MDINTNYTKYCHYLKSYITRDGIDSLIAWLNQSDAKFAPASTRYHLSEDGGFIQHSLNVFMRLINLLKDETNLGTMYTKESIAIVALLHDISKVGYYKKSFRNIKNEADGHWEAIPCYSVKDENERFTYSTPEESSIFILSQFIKLTPAETTAIRFHMGITDKANENLIYTAYQKYPLALLLHLADMQAICIDEARLSVVHEITPTNEQPTEETQKNEIPQTDVNNECTERQSKDSADQTPF